MNRHPKHAWGTALIRVWLGIVFVMHGYLGYAILGPAAIAGYTTKMGYPIGLGLALAWYLIVVHTVGGLLLVAGLWTRVAALLNVPIMASAVILLHLPQGFFMKGIVLDAASGRAIAGGYEYALTVLIATLAIILLGPGAFSVDHARAAAHDRELP